MALTLEQAQQLSQNKLTGHVIDEFRKSPLLDMLTFDNTVKPQGGKTLAYVYDRITTLPTAAGRALNTEYVPQETAATQFTVNLKIFGGSFEIDRVLADDEVQVVDHVMFQMAQKVKATRAKFHDMFINGDAGIGDGTDFDGLDKALTGSSTELIPETAIDLSGSAAITSNWQSFLDTLRLLRSLMDGAPTMYLMNGAMFAKFQSVMDRAGINQITKANYGDEVFGWGSSIVAAMGDKPGTSNPVVEIGSNVTSIFAVRLGLDGVHGVSPDGSKIVRQFLPDMKSPGAVKKGEVEMVAAMAVEATRSAAVLRNVKIV